MNHNNEFKDDPFSYFEDDISTDLHLWREKMCVFHREAIEDAHTVFNIEYGRAAYLSDDEDVQILRSSVDESLERKLMEATEDGLHKGDVVSISGVFVVYQKDESGLLYPETIQDTTLRVCGVLECFRSFPYLSSDYLQSNDDEIMPTDASDLNEDFGFHLVLRDAYIYDDETQKTTCFNGVVTIPIEYPELQLRREVNVLSDQA